MSAASPKTQDKAAEHLTKEILGFMPRPMQKPWLDDNLPFMVERRVRAEIERVFRGG
jgi:cell pole-organizing protein PopZ